MVLEKLKILRTERLAGRNPTDQPQKVKSAREKLNMTQEEFAEQLGVSVQAVRSWEQGLRTPGDFSQVMLNALLTEIKNE
jgi:DNA-binding transcriptional regulator YiaG